MLYFDLEAYEKDHEDDCLDCDQSDCICNGDCWIGEEPEEPSEKKNIVGYDDIFDEEVEE